MKITNILRKFGIVLLIIVHGVIVYFSLFCKLNPFSPFASDRFLHPIAYAALGFSLYLSFMPLEKSYKDEGDEKLYLANSFTFLIVKLFFYGLMFGTIMEVMQLLVKRSCSLMDIAADALGLIVGFAASYLFLSLWNSFIRHLPA